MRTREVGPIVTLLLVTSCRSPSSPPAGGGSAAAARPSIELPRVEAFRLANGLEVWLLPSPPSELVTLSLVVRAGSALDPPGKEGLAALTATMLDEGAGARGPLEIADEIDFLGAELSVDAEKESLQVSLRVLDKNLDRALEIAADVVARPAFLEKEWDRVKTLWLNDLVQRREEPREVARLAAERAFYGERHPYAHPADGYEASATAIELPDVRAFHEARVRPEASVLLVAASLPAGNLRPRLEKAFSNWQAGGAPAVNVPVPLDGPATSRLVVVDRQDAPQTEIRILVPAPAFGDPGVPPLLLANLAFGGTFTSRLMSNLRERQKITYGASSGFAPRSLPGHLAAGTAVHAEKTGTALVELCREYRAIAARGISAGELEKARAGYASRILEALETQSGTIGIFIESAAMGAPPEERGEFYRRFHGVSGDEVSAAAARTLIWERATIVLVGDRRVIEPAVREIETGSPGVEGAPVRLPPAEHRGREGESAP
jgi:zinc protease